MELRAVTNFARLWMPTMDFYRALNERPVWVKLLFRLLVGKWAYSEFMIAMRIIQQEGHDPLYSYGLEHANYHKSEPWRWWEVRVPYKGSK